MIKPSTQLIDFVCEAQLPWISYSEERGRLVLVIDNHLLSTYRACPQYFMNYAVEGWRKRSEFGPGVEKNWFLDFGILFHKMMEEYYRSFREESFTLESFAIDSAFKHWDEMGMDQHLSHKEAQEMGGYPGFAGMLIQYAVQFKAENERLRVISTEIAFGKKHEVPIYEWGGPESDSPLFCHADIYLAGRIDILADDGIYILPMDHKTMGIFPKDPTIRFHTDDGPTGYVYAMNKILPRIISPELILKRQCNKILMNLISKRVPKEGSRFKRLPLFKSEAMLEAYRQRQIGTVNNLLSDLDSYVRSLGVQRDSSKCYNWYYKDCAYLDVCRQQDASAEQATLQNGFTKLKIWDTEALNDITE